MFEYVEMKFDLLNFNNVPHNIDMVCFKKLTSHNKEQCLDIYLNTFSASDAEFFKQQNHQEQLNYFENELGLPDAYKYAESIIVEYDGKPIGFSMGIDYGQNNFHISCMCISPSYQGMGIGKLLLNHIAFASSSRGIKSISLGTEKNMKAYSLYSKFGFKITNTHIIDKV